MGKRKTAAKRKPGRMVTLQCPECDRQKKTWRESYDPPDAVTCIVVCDRCSKNGDIEDSCVYMDADGNELDPGL